MAKRPAVEIPVKLKKGTAEKDVKALAKSMFKSFTDIKSAFDLAAGGLRMFGKALGSVNKLAKESIKLAMVQQENERKLMQAANMRGKFTKRQFEELQRLNSETQQATGIGDEYQLQLQAQLAMMGVSNDELVRATRATIGLSEATGSDLNSSMRIVARTLQGNTSSLKRYGIQARDSNEAMEMLLQNFEIAKDKGKTLSGQIKILGANFGDLQETWGMGVAKSDRVVSGFEAINRSVMKLNTFFSSADGARAIDRWFKTLLGFAASTINAFTQIIRLGDAMLGNESPAIAREQARNKFFEENAKYLGGLYSPELQMFVTRESLSKAAKEYAQKLIPMTLAELAEGVADELLAVSKAPFVPGGRAIATGGGGGGGGLTEKQKKKKILETQKALAAIQKAWDERSKARNEQRRELAGLLLKQEISQNDLRFNAELNAFEQRQALKDRELQATAQFYDNLKVIGLSGLSGMISGLVAAGLSGEKSLSEVMGSMFGGILSQVGQMMISLGTAAFIAASATAPIPLLWPIFGGKIGMAGALGLIGAGSVLTGVGQYMSSTASGAKAEMGKAQGAAARMAPGSAADTGRASSPTERTTTTYNINFNGALPGSERRIAKEVRRILDGNFSPAGAY